MLLKKPIAIVMPTATTTPRTAVANPNAMLCCLRKGEEGVVLTVLKFCAVLIGGKAEGKAEP